MDRLCPSYRVASPARPWSAGSQEARESTARESFWHPGAVQPLAKGSRAELAGSSLCGIPRRSTRGRRAEPGQSYCIFPADPQGQAAPNGTMAPAMATTMRTTEDEFPEFAAVTHAREIAQTPGPPAWATLKVKTGHAPKPKVDRAYVPPPLPSMAAYRFARHQELWKRSEPERLGYERLRRKREEADAADRKQTLYWGKVSLGRAQAAPRDFWRKGPYKKGPTRSSSTMDGPADLGGEAVLDWSEMADVCYDIVTGGATGGANKAQVAKRLNDMRVRPAKNIYEYLRMPPSKKDLRAVS